MMRLEGYYQKMYACMGYLIPNQERLSSITYRRTEERNCRIVQVCHSLLITSRVIIIIQLYYMFSSSYLERCTRCTQESFSPFRYCCNEDDRLCILCSRKKCPKCREYPIKICKRKKSRQEECCKCLAKKATSSHYEFFCESTSQRFYCFPCLLEQYQKYNLSVSTIQKGKELPFVQLEENVKVQKKAVIEFLQKYCFVCNEKTYGHGIKLKNECLVMFSCFDQLKNSVEYSLASKQEKKVYEELESLVNRCCSCQKIVSGDQIGSKEEDGIIFCSQCVKVCSLSESLYQPDWNKNKQKQQQSLRRSRVNPKEEAKMDKGSSEKKRQKDKPHLVNASRYFIYQCQLCNEGISTKIYGQNICFSCYNKTFSESDECPLLNVDLGPPKQNERTDKDRKEQIKMMAQKNQVKQSSLEQNKEQIKEQNNNKQEQVKSTLKNKRKLTIMQKKKDTEEIAHQKLKDQNAPIANKQEIEPSKNLLLQGKVSIHQQFLPLDPISLQIKILQEKVSQCIKCGYFVSKDDSFRAYLRQGKNDTTLRIAQTTSELQKYEKENKIVIYCKHCYYQQKENHEQEAKIKKLQESQNRIFKSLPKKEKDMERQSLQGTYTDYKRDKERIRPAESYLDFFCMACYGRVSIDQFNFSDRICKKCDKIKQQKTKINKQSAKICKLCKDPINDILKRFDKDMCDKCFLYPSRRLI